MGSYEEAPSLRYSWLVLGSYMILLTTTQLFFINFSPIALTVERALNVSESQVGLLTLIFPLMYVLFSVPAGILVDRKGFRYTVLVGEVVTVLSVFARVPGTYLSLFVGQVGIAVGQPFIINSLEKLVVTLFPAERKGLATGLATVSLSAGMAVGMSLTPRLVARSSLSTMLVIYSVAALAAALPFAAFCRREETAFSEGRTVTVASDFGKLLRISELTAAVVLSFIYVGSINGLLTWVQKIFGPSGIGEVQSGTVGAAVATGGMFGSALIPALSDKYQRRRPFILLSLGMMIPALLLVPILEGGLEFLIADGLILGFFLFSGFPLLLTVSGDIMERELVGSAAAMLMLGGNIGGVVVTFLLEYLAGLTGTFFNSVLFLVFMLSVGILVSVRIRR
jgi:MFS family permease